MVNFNEFLEFVTNFHTTKNLYDYAFQIRKVHPKAIVKRDIQKRHDFVNNELKRSTLKYVALFPEIPVVIRQTARNELVHMPRRFSSNQIRKRCILHCRSRGVVYPYNIGRMIYRHHAEKGQLSGVIHSKF